jgi:photosystem II stability/assembly factor-like uncharacterized protein
VGNRTDPWVLVYTYSGVVVYLQDGSERSSDWGQTWTPVVESARVPQDLTSVAAAPQFSMTRTLLANGGTYRSTDGGLTWSTPLTLPLRGAVAFSPNFAADHTVFSSSGYRSKDGGLTWQQVTEYGGMDVAASPAYASDHTVFLTGSFEGVLRSRNGGDTWETVLAGYYTHVAISPAFAIDHMMFVGGDVGNLKSSYNGGDTWVPLYGIPNQKVLALEVSPNYFTDRRVFVSLSTVLYLTTTDGSSWTPISVGAQALNSIAFSRDYASTGRMWASAMGFGVFESNDRGATWQNVGGALDHSVTGLAATDSGDALLFASTHEGLFRYAEYVPTATPTATSTPTMTATPTPQATATATPAVSPTRWRRMWLPVVMR